MAYHGCQAGTTQLKVTALKHLCPALARCDHPLYCVGAERGH